MSFFKELKSSQYHNYLATLYADKADREAISIIYCFEYEIIKLQYQTLNYPLVNIKIRWWVDILKQIEATNEVTEHVPLAKALAKVISKYNLPINDFISYCENQVAGDTSIVSVDDFAKYALATKGIIIKLVCDILAFNRKNILPRQIIEKTSIVLLGQDILRNFLHERSNIIIPKVIMSSLGLANNINILKLTSEEQKSIYQLFSEFIFDIYSDLQKQLKFIAADKISTTDIANNAIVVSEQVQLNEILMPAFLPLAVTSLYHKYYLKLKDSDLVNKLEIGKIASQWLFLCSFIRLRLPVIKL